jgi:hypothetical protein
VTLEEDNGPAEGLGRMKLTRSTIITGLAVLVLIAAIPDAIRDTLAHGRIHLFSWQFLAELPARLTGPGRFRFVMQPATAIFLGVRGGIADARAGRPPYLLGLFFDPLHRREYVRTGLTAIRDLVALGIILDVVAQYLIFGQVHPGAAVVIGPVLITAPYALARAAANRVTRIVGRRASP